MVRVIGDCKEGRRVVAFSNRLEGWSIVGMAGQVWRYEFSKLVNYFGVSLENSSRYR